MNIRLTKRESVLISIFVILAEIIFGAGFLIMPAYDSWVTRKAQIELLKLPTQDITNEISASSSSDTGEIGYWTNYFPPTYDTEAYHYYFKDLIRPSGLELESIVISEDSGLQGRLPENFSLIKVTLLLNGTQKQFMNFLNAFDENQKAAAIGNIRITPVESGSDNSSVVNYNVSFHLYCFDNGKATETEYVAARPNAADGFRFSEDVAQKSGGEVK